VAKPPVINASPLIVLTRGGHPEVLRAAGERIVVPLSVATEIRQRGADDPTVRLLAEAGWLEVVPAGPLPEQIADLRLDPGESAVLAWALAHPGTEAILDDLRARRAADRLGITVRGTLGHIIVAKDLGIITHARPVIEDIRRAGLYLSDRVIGQTLARAGE
jgi:predicted nucleic acid-binding protein